MDTTIMHEEISHCLRTPLTSVLGYSVTLMDRWDSLDEETRLELLKVIYSEALRMSHSIESVDRRLYAHFADGEGSHPSPYGPPEIAPYVGATSLPVAS
jgi:light-regulated signal transduction histidine kinase (bacteriophytochrome)